MRLELPMPPTINTYFGYVVIPGQKHPRRYVGTKGKRFRRDVQACVASQCDAEFEPFARSVDVEIAVWWRDRRKQDLDNRIKALFNALTEAGVWLDDSQVTRFSVYTAGVKKPGSVIVTIDGK